MRVLIDVGPTPEQLSLISRIQTGVEVIRGAAGSGKTTTALLKLRSSIGSFLNRSRRQRRTDPITILLLTYNRTLRGYVAELAHKQFTANDAIQLEVSTFAKWAKNAQGTHVRILNGFDELLPCSVLNTFCSNTKLEQNFVREEVVYLLGKYLPQDLSQYLTARRDGRGAVPRMPYAIRELLLKEIVFPYIEAKKEANLLDWNDLALGMIESKFYAYDIVIVDETQDFSANQIRAVMNQLLEVHSVTFILDTVQRIYASGFTWNEVGINIRPENSFRLQTNYRNTKEIAQFAASLLTDLTTDDDGTVPNFLASKRHGEIPIVLKGKFDQQVKYAIDCINTCIDLNTQSVAFLHPLGGGWFDRLRKFLIEAGLEYVEITQKSEWPTGSENIALSTLHSAKGLEFDHVFILGLNSEVLPHGEDSEDERLIKLRRLLAMGIGRAKMTVTLGYKPADASKVIGFLGRETYIEKTV
jgi:superfamily I DNA/RNA helicase